MSGAASADLKGRIEAIIATQPSEKIGPFKKTILASGLIALLFAGYQVAGSDSNLAVASTTQVGKGLVIRNIPSWGREQDFEDVLERLGYAFEVRESSEITATTLSEYDFVVLPGAQWNTGFYGDFEDSFPAFEEYVREGGTLLAELNGAEREGISLPGGVSMVIHQAFDNVLLFPDHPMVRPLRDRPRITANLASHGYLIGVPPGAILVGSELPEGQIEPDVGKPTFVEYAYGDGRIIAAAQCFHDQDGSGRGPLMQSVLQYTAERNWVAAAAVPADIVAGSSDSYHVDSDQLDRYEGSYRFFGDRVVHVSAADDRLVLSTEESGKNAVEFFPEGPDRFFARVVDAQISFTFGDDGAQARQIALHQNERDARGSRVNGVGGRSGGLATDWRIRDGVPNPASREAIEWSIVELASGAPDYERMGAGLASATRDQLPETVELLTRLGSLESISFSKVGVKGWDHFDVDFSGGTVSWGIYVGPDNKIMGSFFREVRQGDRK